MTFIDVYPWLLAPMIFIARVLDVSMGTFRTLVVFRGYPALAALIGFAEILIWVAASSQVLGRMDAWPLMIAYAGGFAAGNYLGVWLESKIAIGQELLRIVSTSGDGRIGSSLTACGQQVVALDCKFDGEPAEVLLVTADRRQTGHLLNAVRNIDPDARYTITDLKSVRGEQPVLPRRWPLVPSGWRARGKRK